MKCLFIKIETSKPTLPDMSYCDALQFKTGAMINIIEQNAGHMKKRQLI